MILATIMDFSTYIGLDKYFILFNSVICSFSIIAACINMMAEETRNITDILLDRKIIIPSITFILFFITIHYLKGRTYLADKYEIFLMFYKKMLMQQEHKAILDILSEGVITIESDGLTYFNR